MKGLRTLLIGLGMAIIPPATQYIGAIDWNAVLPAPYSFLVSGLVMVLMRLVTTTPVLKK